VITRVASHEPLAVPSRRSHIPALDGLRGVAILLVLLYHFASYGGLQADVFVDKVVYGFTMAGWAGVDLFFVLSGFLITGILYDAKGAQQFFRSFYMRRCLRIFPLYYGVLALAVVAVPLIYDPAPRYQGFLSDQRWYWTYLLNVRIAAEGWPKFNALAHFWSLAIEEQFYLVWPFVVYLFGRTSLMRICLACVLLALLVRVGLAWAGQGLAAYVLAPARMDALAVGALLALMARGPQGLLPWRRSAFLVTAGTGVILAATLVWRRGLWTLDPLVFTVGFTLLACFFGALLTLAVTSRAGSGSGALFESRPLRFLGRYSYGLYVFHHPILMNVTQFVMIPSLPTILGSQLPGLAIFSGIVGGVSLAVALLSWHLYESRFLNLKTRFPYSQPGRDIAVSRA
jgi:peptidoglycan/LPS O-acetylase OafA/YrhL